MKRKASQSMIALCLLGALASCDAAIGQQTQLSPRDQLQQYVTQLQAKPSDDALRTKIIQLALTLDPKPADPADLPETIGAATYAFKSAQSGTDLVNAANLYAKATLEAPWRADLYFNEGVAFEKAKRLDDAIQAYQFYLLAAPNATDSEAVKENIGALKYQLTQKQAADTAQRQQQEAANERYEEQQREQAELQSMWSGVWRETAGGMNPDPYRSSHTWFHIVGDEIVITDCYDRNWRAVKEGQIVSYSGRVSGRMATIDTTDFGSYYYQLDPLANRIALTHPSDPSFGTRVLSRINDPSLISPRCPQ